MQKLSGARALITGSGRGIGRAIALELASRGVHVAIVDLDEQAAIDTAEQAHQCGVETLAIACDLTDTTEMDAVVEQLLLTWPSLEILVNNAGIAHYGRTEEASLDDFHQTLGINLHVPIRLTQTLLPLLLARPQAHVLNVCSVLGLVPMRKTAAYQTSKFGLVGYSRSLRAEFWGRGLGVTALCPGFVQTQMLADEGRQPPRWLCTTPEKIARRAVRAIERNQGVVTLTPLARLAWWLDRLSPTLMDVVSRGRIRQKRAAASPPRPHFAPAGGAQVATGTQTAKGT